MDKTEALLEKETQKWLQKLMVEIEDLKVQKKPGARSVEKNLKAYIEDTSYFLKKKDYLRAFEAVVYAWGILETGRMAKVLI